MNNYSTITMEGVTYAGEMAKWVLSDGKNLMQFLPLMGRFSNYSINNILLIMAYKNTATEIRSMEEWYKLGIAVNEGYQPIYIIEPTKGKREFQWKMMVDVSDTSKGVAERAQNKLETLEAMLANHTADITVVDQIKSNMQRALYAPKDGKILVQRSANAPVDDFFLAIVSELVHKEEASKIEGAYPRSTKLLQAMSTAMALGSFYGMDVSNIDLSGLPERYQTLSASGAKDELEYIRRHVNRLFNEIQDSLKLMGREMEQVERQ